jgi:hypothetical protein
LGHVLSRLRLVCGKKRPRSATLALYMDGLDATEEYAAAQAQPSLPMALQRSAELGDEMRDAISPSPGYCSDAATAAAHQIPRLSELVQAGLPVSVCMCVPCLAQVR